MKSLLIPVRALKSPANIVEPIVWKKFMSFSRVLKSLGSK